MSEALTTAEMLRTWIMIGSFAIGALAMRTWDWTKAWVKGEIT